jgi:predicted RND superfamily exporter protein
VPRRFERAFAWTVDYPKTAALLILAVSGLALLGYVAPERLTQLFTQPPLSPTESRSVQPASSEPMPLPDVERFSLTDSDVILVVDSEDFFTSDGVAALRDIVGQLESLDYVERVLWMDRVPVLNIFGLNEPLLPRARASTRQFEAAREKALRHPLVAGNFLSSDGRTLLMLIKLNWLFVESDEDCTNGIRQTAAKAAAEHPQVDMQFLVTGRVPMYLAFMNSQRENQAKYQIIGYSMTGLMALLLFRGIRAVLIVSLAPSLGVFWSLGMLRFFDIHDNPFNDVVLPVLISLIGLTDGVHLMVETRKQRAMDLSEREAARAGISKVGLACGLTSLTTAIGFASLGWAHHEIVREFGWSCVLGAALTFLAVITIIPLACATPLGRNLHLGLEQGLIERSLGRISGMIDSVLRRSRVISAGAVLSTAALTLIALQLRPDEKRSSSLPSRSEAVVALAHMDRAFGGLERGEVEVHWPDAMAQDSPEVLRVLGEVHALLDREKLIGHSLSIHSLLEALPGSGSAEQRMSMLELLPPPLKRAFYTPEHRQANVSFRVQDMGIAAYGPVFLRIQDGLGEIAARHPGFSMWLSGSAVDRWQNLHQIVVDLAKSLGSAAFVIFGVLMLAYRSIRLGLIAVIPNVFPLAATGTFLVLTGQSLEIVSVCAFTVCLGIAVDDTIHFLTRYQEELEHHGEREAIRRAFTGVGTALIMTTVVLVAGFSTVIFSDLRDQRVFATMGALTIGTALFGDLVLLPALLAQFAGGAESRGTGLGRPAQAVAAESKVSGGVEP